MAARMRWPLLLTVTTREPGDGQEPVQQQAGEGEVAEVVGAELQLEAVGGRLLRGVHHAGVVDQKVDARVGGAQVGRRGPDRVQGGQVEGLDGDVAGDAGGCLLALLDVADGQDHRRPARGEHPGGLEAEPGVGAGHDRHPAVLIGDVLLGPVAAHGALLKNHRPVMRTNFIPLPGDLGPP
jgi:hypothetical protein